MRWVMADGECSLDNFIFTIGSTGKKNTVLMRVLCSIRVMVFLLNKNKIHVHVLILDME